MWSETTAGSATSERNHAHGARCHVIRSHTQPDPGAPIMEGGSRASPASREHSEASNNLSTAAPLTEAQRAAIAANRARALARLSKRQPYRPSLKLSSPKRSAVVDETKSQVASNGGHHGRVDIVSAWCPHVTL